MKCFKLMNLKQKFEFESHGLRLGKYVVLLVLLLLKVAHGL